MPGVITVTRDVLAALIEQLRFRAWPQAVFFEQRFDRPCRDALGARQQSRLVAFAKMLCQPVKIGLAIDFLLVVTQQCVDIIGVCLRLPGRYFDIVFWP